MANVEDSAKTVRTTIERQFSAVLKDKSKIKLEGITDEEAYGHLAGTPIEEWFRTNLEDKFKGKVFYPNQFVEAYFQKIGKNKAEIRKFLDANWWGKLIVTPKQIDKFLAGEKVKRWQQEAADIVLFCGEDMMKNSSDVILINVKSHEITRKSRPPNIMSAQRLLVFLNYALSEKPMFVEQAQLFFVGIDYKNEKQYSFVTGFHIKDLFKLDVEQLPQINFDAALQIQWHVRDMIEINQTRKEFIRDLASTFLEQWNRHSAQKTKKYTALVSNIESLLEKLKT